MTTDNKVAPTAKETEKDYVAIFWIAGGSSYVRANDKCQAVNDLRKQIVADWGGLFKLAGREVKIAIFDVTGYDDLWWDHQVHVEGSDTVIPLLEIATVTL